MKATHGNEKNENFKGITVYAGIDVHLRSWSVTIRIEDLEIKTFSMNPKPLELANYLRKNYPDAAAYHAAYEAGFCGFYPYDELTSVGIKCLVVNAADVPTTDKEKVTKTDKIDSRKLARELAKGNLEGIYVPPTLQRKMRSLNRLRDSLVRDQTRMKNRIKSHLYFYGVDVNEVSESKHWSAAFIEDLSGYAASEDPAALTLRHMLEVLKSGREHLLQVIRDLRRMLKKHKSEELSSLLSVPGVGFITAATLLCEIWEIERFSREDRLASYTGLIPSTYDSGETRKTGGLTPRRNKRLKHLIIEAAWIAVRRDTGLTACFFRHAQRMAKNKAIIRIASKLLNRIRHVWRHNTTYQVQLPA